MGTSIYFMFHLFILKRHTHNVYRGAGWRSTSKPLGNVKILLCSCTVVEVSGYNFSSVNSKN